MKSDVQTLDVSLTFLLSFDRRYNIGLLVLMKKKVKVLLSINIEYYKTGRNISLQNTLQKARYFSQKAIYKISIISFN